ncbi:uncharacterized protein Bfra_005497 [Botrytis fragariae]|uniref:Uncharacterized protein n=1 Tax=Botrytis fragariae TaxID=1964551 RepID=A0A8H6ARE9_9HELO|nr:uncharacterized protein Bfra_005497 [Botrytis fragariae]KAF5872143.1 hypothetical protein Bfra_005497 [Botrytis fragariae]
MLASIQKLAILALFFGLSAAAPAPATASDAVIQVSTEALTAFGLTEDMVAATNITNRDVLEARAVLATLLAEYLTKHMGCPTDGIWGGAARPIGQITAHRCEGPGPEYIDQGAQGWSINSSFNEEPCLSAPLLSSNAGLDCELLSEALEH